MSARWSPPRPEPDEAAIRSGVAVSSQTWLSLALLGDWLRSGAFGPTVVCGLTTETVIAKSAERIFNFRYKTRYAACQRIWLIGLRATALSAVTVTVKVPATTGTAVVVPVSNSDGARVHAVYLEDLSSQTNATTSLTIGFNATGNDVVLDSLTCFEVPRGQLVLNASEYGVDVESERAGERIFASSNRSVLGVRDALTNQDARRTALYSWAIPDNAPLTTTAAAYLGGAGIFALGQPILARKLANAATTASVKWNVYAKITGGATGKVKLTTSQSAVSSEISVTGAGYAWQTDTAVSVQCDNMTASDGLQASLWDEMTFDFKSDGVQTISIAAISIWEE